VPNLQAQAVGRFAYAYGPQFDGECPGRINPAGTVPTSSELNVGLRALNRDAFRGKKDVAMTGKYAPPEVTIRSYQLKELEERKEGMH
jgi:hypothetical protein